MHLRSTSFSHRLKNVVVKIAILNSEKRIENDFLMCNNIYVTSERHVVTAHSDMVLRVVTDTIRQSLSKYLSMINRGIDVYLGFFVY